MDARVRIRSYDERDERDVAALWRGVFPDLPPWRVPEDDIRTKLTVQRELFLVAEREGGVVGTVMAGFDGHRGWVYFLAVAPALRGGGVGAALMAEAEDRLRRLGCRKLNLQIYPDNAPAVSFYERLGYAVEERVCMAKRLQ